MGHTILDFIATHRIASFITVGIVALLLAKPLIWWLFSFDARIAAILSQKKSSEVRTGKIAESLAPILEDFPVDVKKDGTSTVFLGQPIDFIHFDPAEGITFIEVKSGGARLSESQQRLKKLIEDGQVRWETFRIDGESAAPEGRSLLKIRRRRVS
jgi:hypothetical protein